MRWIVPLALVAAPLAVAAPAFAVGGHESSSSGFSYILYTEGNSTSFGSADLDDLLRADRLRSGKSPMLMVRDNGVAYVIRDRAILARAAAIMAPQQELGRRQGALGTRQGELGRRQGALGSQQAQLGSRMASSTPAQMDDLGNRMAALGRQQSALGEQQAALGRQQAELGRQQGQLAEQAGPKLRALVADAIRSGAAQRLN